MVVGKKVLFAFQNEVCIVKETGFASSEVSKVIIRYISKPQPPAGLASGHFCNRVHHKP